MNRTKYGYDAAGNVLRLSLLRSPTSPDPLADGGRQRFMYALYPHAGDWKQAMTPRPAYERNYDLLASQVIAHTGVMPPSHSFLTVDEDNVMLTAMKKAEDSNSLIIRMFEWAGKNGGGLLHAA
jgi:alpha-mannosidase